MGCDENSAIVLLSGGQDSTTALFWAKGHWDNVKALTIDYGQRHSIELIAAKKIAKIADVGQEELYIPGNTLKGGFLLGPGEIPEDFEGIAPTFVPGRNLLFLTIAANRAYTLGIPNIVIGTSQVDFSGYPDCRYEFIKSFEYCALNAFERQIKIYTPLMFLSKADTVELAMTLDGCYEALEHTHTCYNGEFPPCGHCPACLLREQGFLEAGVSDPLIERAKKLC